MDYDILLEQNKDRDWWIKIFEQYVPYGTSVNSDRYNRLVATYGIINNDLSYIRGYLTTMNDPTAGLFSAKFPDLLAGMPIMYNRIYPKFEYHVNQIKNKVDNYDIIPQDEGANKFKEDEFNEKLSEFVNKQMLAVQNIQNALVEGRITEQEVQTQMQELQNEEPPSYDTYTSNVEQFYQGILDYFHYKFPVKQLKQLTGVHALCSDDVYIGIVDEGEPIPIVFNSITVGHHKSPDNQEIESGDLFYNTNTVTIGDAYIEVLEYGEESDMEKIKRYAGAYNTYTRPNKNWDIKSGNAKGTYDYSKVAIAKNYYGPHNKLIGQSTGVRGGNSTQEENLVTRTYLVVRAFEKVKVLTYIDEYNKTIKEFVDLDYPIPNEAEEIIRKDVYGRSIKEKQWIDEFNNPISITTKVIARNYHAVRYDDLDIYLKMGEVPYQEFNPTELNVKGRMISSVNSEGISLVERGIPGLAQSIFVKLLQNREMSKYKGVLENIDASQIPDYLAADDEGKPLYEGADKLAVYEYFQKVLGKSVSDSTYNKLGLSNPSRPKASTFEISQAFAEIMNMQMFLDLLDREIGVQMLVPPQAEGIIERYTTRGDNQEAQMNAFVMASGYYDAISEVWRKAIQEYLIQFVNYYRRYFEDHPDKSEVRLNYVTSDGTRKILEIIPEYLNFNDIGLYIKDSNQNEEYRQMMQQYTLQALSQNRAEGAEQMSLIMNSLSKNQSPEKIHKMIVVAARKQQDRMERLQKQLEQIKLATEQEKTKQLQMELDSKERIAAANNKTQIEGKVIDSYKMQDDLNKDQDGIDDQLEGLIALRKLEQDDEKLDIDRQKVNIEQQKVAKEVSKKE